MRRIATKNAQSDYTPSATIATQRGSRAREVAGQQHGSELTDPIVVRKTRGAQILQSGPALIDLNVLDKACAAQLLPHGHRREDALIRAMSMAKQALMSLTAVTRSPGAVPSLRKQLVDRTQMSELWELYTDEHGRFQEPQMKQLALDIVQIARGCLHDALRVDGAIAKRSWQWDSDEMHLATVRSAVEAQLAAFEHDPASYLWKLYPANVCFLVRRNDENSSSTDDGGSCSSSQSQFVSKAAAQLFAGGEFDLANLVPQVLDRLVSGAEPANLRKSTIDID
jgi:hypothetical protein